jgi:hypothetical protein
MRTTTRRFGFFGYFYFTEVRSGALT